MGIRAACGFVYRPLHLIELVPVYEQSLLGDASSSAETGTNLAHRVYRPASLPLPAICSTVSAELGTFNFPLHI